MKTRFITAILGVFLILLGCTDRDDTKVLPSPPMVDRMAKNPIITRDMLPGNDGNNINGPSLIRVPPWVKNAIQNARVT